MGDHKQPTPPPHPSMKPDPPPAPPRPEYPMHYGKIDLIGNADIFEREVKLESERRHQFRPGVSTESHQRRNHVTMQKIFVGNVSFTTSEDELKSHIETNAKVRIQKLEAKYDRETGRFRGFAFVSVDGKDVDRVLALDGSTLDERKLTVNVARPQEARV